MDLIGSWPVLVTPYDDNLKIDIGAYRDVIQWQIEMGSHGIYALCLSSEMYLLNKDERILLIEEAVKTCAGKIPVAVTGNLGETVEDHIEFSQIAHDLGADVVMITVPPHLDSDKDLSDYFMKIADGTTAHLGLYECPFPRQFHLSIELIEQLGRSGRFHAFKETSCEMDKITAVIQALKGSNVAMLQANIPFFVDAQLAGAHGSMNVVANWLPDLAAEVYNKIEAGEVEEAKILHESLCAMEMAQRSIHPTGVKYLMSKRGVNIKPNTRRDQAFSNEVRKSLDLCSSIWFNEDGSLCVLTKDHISANL